MFSRTIYNKDMNDTHDISEKPKTEKDVALKTATKNKTKQKPEQGDKSCKPSAMYQT